MSRAAVSSQTFVQPLLLTHSSMSSESSLRSKRDSVVNLVPRPSLKPSARHSSADDMAPTVYRLYPQQAPDSRRSLRPFSAQKNRDRTGAGFENHSAHTSVSEDSIINAAAPDTDYRHSYRTSVPQTYTPEFGNDYDDAEAMTAGNEDEPRSSGTHRYSARRQAPLVRKPSGSVASVAYTDSADTPTQRGYGGPGDRSSADSDFSQHTTATSIQTLPALQTKGPDNSDAQQLEPVLEDDPRSWDLIPPTEEAVGTGIYALESRAEQLFSSAHLHTIFEDPKMLLKFTGFLNSHRPSSIAVLIYYLDALKAIRAINYANAIAEALAPLPEHNFTQSAPEPTINLKLEEKADAAFDILVREDLPAYVVHIWIQVVKVSIQRRITGTLAPHLREASEGLAEVFCLTDPQRTDNPIVFASEEFARTTQYGMNYAIGRNCRFLQGPRTNPHAVRRLAEAIATSRGHSEVLVNYRRDGSPFLNLLMMAPLMDSRGNTRYFIGAQVDVSGLLKDGSNIETLIKLVEREERAEAGEDVNANEKDSFQELSEMFNGAELDTVRRHGGRMHKEYVDDTDRESISGGRPRLLLKDLSQEIIDKQRQTAPDGVQPSVREALNGRLDGVYQHYLLVRPAPSLRILFTSPSLRVPGILQSPFLHRVGGSSRVRQDLVAALGEGRGVTAKIRWLSKADPDGEGEGRARWIHCTPLLGHSGAVGVWMVVLVDDEAGVAPNRRFRPAPPVASVIGGKDWTNAAAAAVRGGSMSRNERRAADVLAGGRSEVSSPQLQHAIPSRTNTSHQNRSNTPQPVQIDSGRASADPGLGSRPSVTSIRETLGLSPGAASAVAAAAAGSTSEFSFQLK